jgi:hypothetical protein
MKFVNAAFISLFHSVISSGEINEQFKPTNIKRKSNDNFEKPNSKLFKKLPADEEESSSDDHSMFEDIAFIPI